MFSAIGKDSVFSLLLNHFLESEEEENGFQSSLGIVTEVHPLSLRLLDRLHDNDNHYHYHY